MREKKLRLALIFGGRSGEHEVSLASASSVIGAVDRSKYELVAIGVTKQGKWLANSDPQRMLEAVGAEGSSPSGHGRAPLHDESAVAILGDPTQRGLARIEERGGASQSLILDGSVDVLFPLLHGTFGEDGTVQGLLELANIPYVGAGVLASALGMDKALMKALFREREIPVGGYIVVKRADWEKNRGRMTKRIEDEIGYPCFVKPANLGSSVGVSKIHGPDEIAKGIDLAAKYDRKMLVEVAIDGREIEVGVLGNDDPIASVAGEVIPSGEFYDYRAKYIDGKSKLVIPAEIPEKVAGEIRRLAISAFKAIDCAGMARVDLFLERGSNKVYLNEINTIPGFTSVSMYPKLWEASGISYSELIDRLIELALERHADKNRSQTRYDFQ